MRSGFISSWRTSRGTYYRCIAVREKVYERTRDIRLESGAEGLIVGALYQFIREPNPQWHVQPETHWAHARRFVVTLPIMLNAVWQC
jgi:hypothetical protein